MPAVDLPFRRTPGSGGWDKRKAGADVQLMCNDDDFPFSIECKNQEAWSWDGIFKDNPKEKFWSYWTQCKKWAVYQGKVPLLVFTKNFHPDYMANSIGTWKLLPKPVTTTGYIKLFLTGKPKLVICSLEDFAVSYPKNLLLGLNGHKRTRTKKSKRRHKRVPR